MPLRVRALQCSAGNRVLFAQLSFELIEGQCLVLTGPNGSGKTTLLRALAGLTRPSDGEIHWLRDSAEMPKGQLLYQGHQSGWKAELSARENLALQTRLDEIAASGLQITEALEVAGIEPQADLMFARLSAGQRRRVALARLMLDQRPVWLLDEPATALDAQALRLLADLIDRKLASRGLVIAATHQDLGLAVAPRRLDLDSAIAQPRLDLAS